MTLDWLLPLMILAVAALYASVGHAGASGYIAVFALVGLNPALMKPSALALNILVAGVATFQFSRAGLVSWRLLLPMLVASVPAAYLGGSITLSASVFRMMVGAMLLWAAVQTWLAANRTTNEASLARSPSIPVLLAIGLSLGLVSGLTGVGGGIFLSPVLLLMRWAPTRHVSGTAAVFILANSIAALIAMLMQGQALPPSLPVWAGCALAGGWIGAHLGSRRLQAPIIRRLLAVVLLVAAVKMLGT